MTIVTDVFAKLNLSLCLTGRSGGYHTLDSVTVSVTLSDRIELCGPAKTSSVVFTAGETEPPARCEHTLATLLALAHLVGESGLSLRVVKNIPDRAGLGGSSAESAGAILAVSQAYAIPLDDPRLVRVAERAGSDVPVLLNRGFARVGGRGERVRRFDAPAKLHFLLAASGTVETARAFALADERGFDAADAVLHNDELEALLRCGMLPPERLLHNDLYSAACLLEPNVARTKALLRAAGARGVGMTGSGAALFGIFETREAAIRAADRIEAPFVRVCESV